MFKLVTLLAVALLWAPASVAATPADSAATLTYLQAGYQLDQAILRNATASRSTATSLAERLGHECSGVLAGAPNEESGPPSEGSATPRARGERQRSELQLQTIEDEIRRAEDAAFDQPDQGAIEAYDSQISSLSWSDTRIAPLARLEASRQAERLAAPVPDVCADMRSWAQSGYHILSPASREFQAAQMKLEKAAVAQGSLSSLLKPYEGPRARTLIRQTKALQLKIVDALERPSRGISNLQRELGSPEGSFERREREPVLGHGTTRAGTSFTVRRETPEGPPGSSCSRSVAVQFKETARNGRSEGSGGSVCLSGRDKRRPSSSCRGDVESITAAVPASVWTARLQLSNGQTISSRVIRVPVRYGGPGGVYVQAIRGYSPYPVSLSELDRDGKVVLTVKLNAIRCRKEPAATGPTFVDLASSSTPQGEPFTIQGVVVHFGRGQSSFSVTLGIGPHDNGGEGSIETGKAKAFSWSLAHECQPHEFAIVYGILAAPGDSVLARTPAGLVPLTKVPIAANLHSEGPLVYGVFSTVPTELVVLGSGGSTLYAESLTARASEEAEFCQGYTEA